MNQLSAFMLVVFAILGIGNGLTVYPCHKGKDTGIMGKGSTCAQLQIPPGLCSACPLRKTNAKGQFFECWNIYDTESPGCLQKMTEYVDANQCDKPRVDAVAALLKDPTNGDARSMVDYFLYSTCELCCDCVPMNVQYTDYAKLAVKHTAAKPTLWESGRGNCPAHAHYDICKLSSGLTQISKLGTPAAKGRKNACGMLENWTKIPSFFNSWKNDAMQNIEPDLRAFLDETQDALGCANENIWKTCHIMEAKQRNLGDVPNPALQTPSQPSAAAAVEATPSTSAAASKQPKKDVELAASPSASASTEVVKPSVSAPASTEPSAAAKPVQDAPTSLNAAATPSVVEDVPPIVSESTPVAQTGTGASTLSEDETDTSGVGQTISPNEPAATTAPRGGVCFPASGTVQLRDGRRVRMDALSIGDEVLVNTNGKYEPVYLFTHSEPTVTTSHVRITTGEHTVTLSPSHHIGARAARFVRRGDVLETVTGRHPVTYVEYIQANGLYNPHTMSGTIVVNDVVCSTFTETVETRTAHALLAPLRTLFRCGAVQPSAVSWFLPRGTRSLSIL